MGESKYCVRVIRDAKVAKELLMRFRGVLKSAECVLYFGESGVQ